MLRIVVASRAIAPGTVSIGSLGATPRHPLPSLLRPLRTHSARIFNRCILRGAHHFHRTGPYRPGTSLHPRQPVGRDDLDHVRQVFTAWLRPLGYPDMPKPPSLVHGRLDGGSTHARERRDLVDWHVTDL